MTDHTTDPKLDELLSAFLDGETTTKETQALLDRMVHEPHLQIALDRHQRLRASLRGELHPALDDGFLSRVLAGIDLPEARPSRVIAFKSRSRMPVALRATLGMAMAASIAAVTVLSVQTLLPTSEGAFPLTTAGMSGIERTAADDAVRVAAGPAMEQPSERMMSAEDFAELNNYLISHNNSTIDHGLNSTMGFMRVAADDGIELYEADR
jgi:negative regulator of sigma E activity